MRETIGYNLIQILFVLGFAPLYSGVLSRFKEIVQSKRGPSIFQPYRDLWKLFHKDEVVSSETTWIFRVTPYLVFVTPIFVTVLIPVLTDYPLAFAFMGDMLAAGFFLGLAGFFASSSGGRHRQSLRPYGRKPDADGGISCRTGLHDRVLHGFFCRPINDPVHRAAKMDCERSRLLFAGACVVADCVPDADSR